jgi:cobalt-zinc-cadmium efflux system outer membrane protein
MSTFIPCVVMCAVLVPARAGAQVVLTLEETIARARENAGAVAIARARVAEAEAVLVEAAPRFRDNPVLEVVAGPRVGGGSRSSDLELSLAQQFESGGQRASRLAAATASVERQRAEVGQSARAVAIEAASAFLDGVAAMERLQIAEGAENVARELLNVTERRLALGDIAAIDVNLARVAAARSTAAVVAARTDLTAAVGALRALLRIPTGDSIELRGSLALAAAPPLSQLEGVIEQRPEFAVLAAEVRQGEAQSQLGRALRKPDYGIRAIYEREDFDTIVSGGLTITLPAFQKGQGTLAAGTARAGRARAEAEVVRQQVHQELRTAYAVHEQRTALRDALETGVMPSLLDNESLARRSYEAGEMNLMDLLLIRRDAVETRLEIVDRRLEAARSRLMLDVIAGVVR